MVTYPVPVIHRHRNRGRHSGGASAPGASSYTNVKSFKPFSIKVQSIRIGFSIAITIAFEISKSNPAGKFPIKVR
ncbi:MAG: hypothetical protein CVV32_01085 [Methanomicrobiales archaeon HGW-Methanomicrobiales-3]|nr:MAG: hypothetical protein CVV32_01085 [Methanomicrobiales archaeon HGW-Methanomicrobiales-3]